jgi:hypothetical protein
MAALDGAIAKVDALLSSLEAGLSDRAAPPPLRVDPDDPWAETINPPAGVYKARLLHVGRVACRNCACACAIGSVTHTR